MANHSLWTAMVKRTKQDVICPKCGYERTEVDKATPRSTCPKCNVVYTSLLKEITPVSAQLEEQNSVVQTGDITVEPTQTVSHALPAGFVIQEYEFLSVLGMGGFGITYLANDANLKLKVAIKEFFPASLATRDPITNQVAVKSEEYQADFAWGKERFIQEAQTLAKFSHPNIVHIYRYFVANGTGYMVMDYEEGKSLEEALNDKEIQWDDVRVMEFLLPLLDGIAHVHKAGFLHRDIKPGNIVIRKKDSSPVLLDFGSARAALISHTQTLTALISPGYCPVEQYFDDGTQAACTDIYSIGAVLYRIVTGLTPTPSPQRVKKDSMVPAGFAGRQKFGVSLLRAIDKALSIEASKRPQSIEAWQAILQESAQKAELKNISEKASGFVGKGYKRTKKIIPLFVIALLGLLLILGVKEYRVAQSRDAYKQATQVSIGEIDALARLMESAIKGNNSAQANLGYLYLIGDGVSLDYKQALKWYRMAADKSVDASYHVGQIYRYGLGVPKDYAEALKWYRKAAVGLHYFLQPDDARALIALGDMYQKGEGIPQNTTEAFKWYKQGIKRLIDSAHIGDIDSFFYLGDIFLKGKGVPQNNAEALKWYRKAAEQGGHDGAQFALGMMYYDGSGVPQDYAQAAIWFRRANEQNNTEARIQLAKMYYEGKGFPQDIAQAIIWYRKADEKGDWLAGVAQVFMGTAYLEGKDVPQDYAEALKWFTKAAEQNNAKAQNSLADMYESGLGVPKDHEQAEVWRKKALAAQSK
jgi:TPR repeat protein